eukprot:CAMPEP_0174698052 /NCGR_PEP_ID=MMETSP1094-20130205/3739_1 /TAXON_ID=156173 /ORGANISM="Chrysochromulina brevifilum, Strain UTEX LB 985" /LENGTH=57 /DNA_ID=CAMNT_0015895149 /DNA_START=51 /DNA_END=221 /DNA_ORIENTATION=-
MASSHTTREQTQGLHSSQATRAKRVGSRPKDCWSKHDGDTTSQGNCVADAMPYDADP